MNKLTFLLLPALAFPAQAQGLTQAVRNNIDAHATQFTGRHCAGNFKAKPEGEVTVSQFKMGVRVLDAAAKAMVEEAVKDQPGLRYRSSFNGTDLFRSIIQNPR